VQLVGHAGRDSDLKYGQSGTPIMSFSVATSRWQGKDKEPATTWWNVTLFGRLAEAIHERGGITKGDLVNVWGEPYLDNWTGQDGEARQTLKVVASDVFTARTSDRADSAPTGDAAELNEVPF
jgi:single-strand DNA-binding protein